MQQQVKISGIMAKARQEKFEIVICDVIWIETIKCWHLAL